RPSRSAAPRTTRARPAAASSAPPATPRPPPRTRTSSRTPTDIPLLLQGELFLPRITRINTDTAEAEWFPGTVIALLDYRRALALSVFVRVNPWSMQLFRGRRA